jgi:hypothetical protein
MRIIFILSNILIAAKLSENLLCKFCLTKTINSVFDAVALELHVFYQKDNRFVLSLRTKTA